MSKSLTHRFKAEYETTSIGTMTSRLITATNLTQSDIDIMHPQVLAKYLEPVPAAEKASAKSAEEKK